MSEPPAPGRGLTTIVGQGRSPSAHPSERPQPGRHPAGVPTPERLEAVDAAWDGFVEACRDGSYLQTTGWARVKAPNGWSPRRVVVPGPDGPIGVQVLRRRQPPLPWAFAYAPRGPVVGRWSGGAIAALTDALRSDVGHDRARPAAVRIDPPVEAGGPDDPDGSLRASLAASGWRPATSIQPSTTRLIDLSAPEEALWGDLRGKWRQYVNGARRAGVTVVEGDGSALGVFHAILRETSLRTGMAVRTEASYRAVWDAFEPSGKARLLFARDAEGAPQAALFLVRCGDRVVEPYGGMTTAGADLRANYLLKWEAIRRSREAAAATYDLWGLVNPGIAHFKAGFGGREVAYIGGWELPLDTLGDRVVRVALALRERRRGAESSGPGSQDRDDA